MPSLQTTRAIPKKRKLDDMLNGMAKGKHSFTFKKLIFVIWVIDRLSIAIQGACGIRRT